MVCNAFASWLADLPQWDRNVPKPKGLGVSYNQAHDRATSVSTRLGESYFALREIIKR